MILAELWSQTVINNHPIVVEYIVYVDDHGSLTDKNAVVKGEPVFGTDSKNAMMQCVVRKQVHFSL